MSGLEAQPLRLADQVQQAEERWRAWDRWLAHLRQLGDLLRDSTPDDWPIMAAMVVHLNDEQTQNLHARFETCRGLVLEARECLGDDHRLTKTLEDCLLIAFFDCWVWYQITQRVSATIREAHETGENPGIAAHEAVVLGFHDLVPAMTAWYALKVPSDALKLDELVELAARLLVPRDAGDTGIRLYPPQQSALRIEALASVCSITTVVREGLPSACALALANLPDPPDLKRLMDLKVLRKEVMDRLAPRPRKRRDDREAGSESTVMAPLRSSGAATGADGMPIETESPSAEQALLSNLEDQEAQARVLAAVARAEMTPKQRELVLALLERSRFGTLKVTSDKLAAHLGKAAPTVRVQLAQARARLRPLRDQLLGSG